MKFYVSSAFLDTREIVEVAKAADDLGYDGMAIPDHIVNLETLSTPYPYTKDGRAALAAVHRMARPVGSGRRAGASDDPAAVRHHGLHSGDAQSVLGGESHWHRGISGRRPRRAGHRRRLV